MRGDDCLDSRVPRIQVKALNPTLWLLVIVKPSSKFKPITHVLIASHLLQLPHLKSVKITLTKLPLELFFTKKTMQ